MPFQIDILKDRASLYGAVRRYFDSCGYLEAETPVLTPSPIPESHIELFRTDQLMPDGEFTPLYLVPSPEVWLKLLLASGSPSVFQIGKCFRNGEQIDLWHRAEFTMLEWYGLGETATGNLKHIQQLLDRCVQAVNPGVPDDVGGRIRQMSMDQAFLEIAGIPLEADLIESGLADTNPDSPEYESALSRAAQIFRSRLKERNLPLGDEGKETSDDLFHRLFITLIEDELPRDKPLALTRWPALVPTLARRVSGTPWAERWELYMRGVEVANCYGEETDEANLNAYWNTEAPKKATAAVPSEHDFNWPAQIAGGMPPCSGVAVGLDRLLALIRGDRHLEGLDLFPIHDIMPR